jgi:hypothetical protein
MTQGKIEQYHRAKKNRVLQDNYHRLNERLGFINDNSYRVNFKPKQLYYSYAFARM